MSAAKFLGLAPLCRIKAITVELPVPPDRLVEGAEPQRWPTKAHPAVALPTPEEVRGTRVATREQLASFWKPVNDHFKKVLHKRVPELDEKVPVRAVIEMGSGFHYNAEVYRTLAKNVAVVGIETRAGDVARSRAFFADQDWYHPVQGFAGDLARNVHLKAFRRLNIPCLFVVRHQEMFAPEQVAGWMTAIDAVIDAMKPGETFLITSYAAFEAAFLLWFLQESPHRHMTPEACHGAFATTIIGQIPADPRIADFGQSLQIRFKKAYDDLLKKPALLRNDTLKLASAGESREIDRLNDGTGFYDGFSIALEKIK